MDRGQEPDLRVALLADNSERIGFRSLLRKLGVEVVAEGNIGVSAPHAWNTADVLLLARRGRLDLGQVQDVLERSPVPVLVNRDGIINSEVWRRRLVGKLKALAARRARDGQIRAPDPLPELRVMKQGHAGEGETLWLVVLGASIGGPRAIARFLSALPENLPVAFLLAQHICEPFQGLLVEQLDRCSAWPVALLGEAQRVKAGQVWMLPASRKIEINARGTIRTSSRAWESTYRPDINAVLRSVADNFGAQSGAIIFSGLGKDGMQGCASIANCGGFVWAQSSESCVIANLPEAARRSCQVEWSGTPEQLAGALDSRCKSAGTSIN